jgi:tetratricopeptide (TPR) repeat protein
MKNLKFIHSLLIYIIILFNISNNLSAKNLTKFEETESISNYFSGVLYLNDNKYLESYKFLKKLNGLEKLHGNYSGSYQYSLISLSKIEEAIKYSQKLKKNNIKDFNSNLLIGIFHLKNKNIDEAKKYFKTLKNFDTNSDIENLLATLLDTWSQIIESKDLNKSISLVQNLSPRLENIKNIQETFIHCYYDSEKTSNIFKKLIENEEIDYSRYFFFHANYLKKNKQIKFAEKTIDISINKFPRNLLFNQFKEDLYENKTSSISNYFDCKNFSHIIAEIFYLVSNALSVQQNHIYSNYYLNLAKYLNADFISYDVLVAENYFIIKENKQSLKIYNKIKEKGSVYKWHSAKQISSIYLRQEKKDKAIDFIEVIFGQIKNPKIYEIYEYASFLRNNESHQEAIKYYSKVLKKIKKTHPLYSKTTDGRAISYERTNQWKKAEVDFLNSLEADPNQAYVINYLAYSWIEKGIKIEQSLKMLKKANELKKNDGYITDSLGWALFKLKKYEEAKNYLQLAVRIMPSDPIVNDHFGDALWMSGRKLQARYYWNYVLKLAATKDDQREQIKNKLIFGKKNKI